MENQTAKQDALEAVENTADVKSAVQDGRSETLSAPEDGSETAPQPAGLTPADAAIMGAVSWLMLHSPTHRHLFINDFEWLVLPPLSLKQYRLFRHGERPVGFVTWAFLDEESEARLLSGVKRLPPVDWNGGDRPWIIDLMAPFGGGEAMIKELQEQVFKVQSFKAMQRMEDGSMQAKEWR